MLATDHFDLPAGVNAPDFSPVNILMYHNVEERARGPEYNHFYVLASEFKRQMIGLLAGGYRPCSLRQLGDAVTGSGSRTLPDKAFVVTFDDGYSNLYSMVHPLMMELSIPYTVFVVSDRIGGRSEWVVPEGFTPSPLLSWTEIEEMRNWNGASMQAHTCTHARLESLSLSDAASEMLRCKEILEQRLGSEVDQICYPYGSVNEAIAQSAADMGYRVGVTTQFGRARLGDRPLLLPRVSVHHVPLLSLKYGPRSANFWWRIKTRKDSRPSTFRRIDKDSKLIPRAIAPQAPVLRKITKHGSAAR